MMKLWWEVVISKLREENQKQGKDLHVYIKNEEEEKKIGGFFFFFSSNK